MKLKKKYQDLLGVLIIIGIILCASDSECLETFYRVHIIGGLMILIPGLILAKWGSIFDL